MGGEEILEKHPSVLVVEDEPMLLLVAAETLRDSGYDVREAGEGLAAMALLEAHPEIELLITDVKMPGMSGYQLTEAALARRPRLKVVLMTGYAQEPLPKALKDLGIQFLYKPFDISRLLALADSIVGRTSAR